MLKDTAFHPPRQKALPSTKSLPYKPPQLSQTPQPTITQPIELTTKHNWHNLC